MIYFKFDFWIIGYCTLNKINFKKQFKFFISKKKQDENNLKNCKLNNCLGPLLKSKFCWKLMTEFESKFILLEIKNSEFYEVPDFLDKSVYPKMLALLHWRAFFGIYAFKIH